MHWLDYISSASVICINPNALKHILWSLLSPLHFQALHISSFVVLRIISFIECWLTGSQKKGKSCNIGNYWTSHFQWVWIDPNGDGSLYSNPNKIQTSDMEGGVTQFCLTISQLVRVAARNMYFSILKWSRFIKSDSGSVGNQSGGSFSASNVVHLQEKEFQLVRKKSFQTQKAFIKGSNRGLREGFNQT